MDSLSVSRTRIANSLRNRGYYYFRPEFIEYLADSIQEPMKIALRLTMASNVPEMMLRRYRTGKVTRYASATRGEAHPTLSPHPGGTSSR